MQKDFFSLEENEHWIFDRSIKCAHHKERLELRVSDEADIVELILTRDGKKEITSLNACGFEKLQSLVINYLYCNARNRLSKGMQFASPSFVMSPVEELETKTHRHFRLPGIPDTIISIELTDPKDAQVVLSTEKKAINLTGPQLMAVMNIALALLTLDIIEISPRGEVDET